eukprot:scaffold3.g6641.t1
MQEHFREIGAAIVPHLNAAICGARRHGIPILFTQHGHRDPEAEEETSVLVAWWGATGSIRYGSPAWRLLPELQREEGDAIITSKRTYDAFQGTELQELLSAAGVDTVIISGGHRGSAFTKNYNVLFLEDGTATSSARHHKASLLNLADGFATVLTCDALCRRLDAGGQAAPAPRDVKW